MKKFCISVFILITGLSSTFGYAQSDVVPSLVVHKSLVPSKDTSYIGLYFKMAPGWHVYWKYPGTAGLPTKIKWQVPAGVKIGGILWPAPERFSQGEGIDGYGYSGDVALLNSVDIPNSVSGGTIAADVRWLGCNGTLCVPGRATLSVPVSEVVAPNKVAQDLSRWIDLLPMPQHEQVMTEDVKITKIGANFHVEAKLTWKIAPDSVEWMPDLGRFLEISSKKVTTTGTVTELAFDLITLPGNIETQKMMDSVVVFTLPGMPQKALDLKFKLE